MKETKNTEKTEDTPALELLPGELPALEVNKLKAQHGKVYRIETAHNGERLVGYFKKPDRKVLGLASKYSAEPMKVGEIMFSNCRVAGDARQETVDEHFLACCVELSSIVQLAESSLVEC
jgi:hypothetical protein